jgi:hypothetical protein
MDALPPGLVEACRLAGDPELRDFAPPPAIIAAVDRHETTGERPTELDAWLRVQADLQADAERLLAELAADSPTGDALPGWIMQPWALRLRMPWSHRLAESIAEARAWR